MLVTSEKLLVIQVLVGLGCCFNLRAEPQILQVGVGQEALLPKGKEADGIVGDFVMRNDLVEVVVSANLPGRKANMSTWWETTAPGCVIDLTLRGKGNDQLTIFSPSGQRGPVSYVRISNRGQDGMVGLETVTAAALNKGIYTRHEYRLKDGWQGVLIETTIRNDSGEARQVLTADRWTSFERTGSVRGIGWADAINPADKRGYAYSWMETEGSTPPPKEVELKAGDKLTMVRFLAVGRSPAEAVGVVAAMRGATGVIEGMVQDEKGNPIPTAMISLRMNGQPLPAYPDDQGRFSFPLPLGEFSLEFTDVGRPAVKKDLVISEGQPAAVNVVMGEASAIAFDIRDEEGQSMPCKVQFVGRGGTATPDLGPAARAHGCRDQYHSETGQFRVQLPPGRYGLIVTRGVEYSHLATSIDLAAGQTQSVPGTLRRLVDSTGWVSADFHTHSTPSGDNNTGTTDRLINLAAEHIEFAPTTEHNRFCDWQPHIERLGLTGDVASTPGIELTGPGAHLNAFPFVPTPFTQDGGAPSWQKDPRLNAIVLRDFQKSEPDRWLQINHPDMVENFVDRDGDGRADGGYLGLPGLIDGLETQNGMTADILARAPFQIRRQRDGQEVVRYVREFIWLQMLNRGHRFWGVAVSDAHSVHGNGVGGWRMYLPSSTDQPAEIDWREISRQAKAGRIMLTSGPFLQVTTQDGAGPGSEIRAAGQVILRVRVQCTDWVDIDRVQVLVNGRQIPQLNFTRQTHPEAFRDGVVRFEREIPVSLSEDSHLIVVACGENFDLSTGYGTSEQAALRPCAYHNPIFVDVDGGGFRANGDALDWPLPVKGLSVEDVKQQLELRGL